MKRPPNGAGVVLPTPSSKLTGLSENNPGHSFTQVCRHSVTLAERLPESHQHFGRLRCALCGRHLRWLSASTPRVVRLPRTYPQSRSLESCGNRRAPQRRCISCYCRVTNSNLGGYSGRSALTGPVWCYRCADYARQLVLLFGGSER